MNGQHQQPFENNTWLQLCCSKTFLFCATLMNRSHLWAKRLLLLYQIRFLLLHVERSLLRWFGHGIRIPPGGFSGKSHLEKTTGQTHGLSSLGKSWDSPRGAEECHWRTGMSGFPLLNLLPLRGRRRWTFLFLFVCFSTCFSSSPKLKWMRNTSQSNYCSV